MFLDHFLSIQATAIGFYGSLLLIRGLFILSPRSIAWQSKNLWGYNPHIMKSICEQKADCISGSIIIAIAFLIQASNYYLTDLIYMIVFPSVIAYTISVLLPIIIVLLIFLFDIFILRHYYFKKAMAIIEYDFVNNSMRDGILSSNNFNDLVSSAQNHFNFPRKTDESENAFINRYFAFLGTKPPVTAVED